MEVLILTIFVSLVLVLAAVGFFAWTLRERVYDHADRLALLPLEEESVQPEASATGGTRNEALTPSAAEGRKVCAFETRSPTE